MPNFVTKLIGDKKEWKAMEARAKVLPPDYRAVYETIKPYMWKQTTDDGTDTIRALDTILTDFEAAAGRHAPVRDVTGADVAAFCDLRLRAAVAAYADRWRAHLNADVTRELAD